VSKFLKFDFFKTILRECTKEATILGECTEEAIEILKDVLPFSSYAAYLRAVKVT